MDSGGQYVVTGGTIEMPLLCVNSWDIMDVSHNNCMLLEN